MRNDSKTMLKENQKSFFSLLVEKGWLWAIAGITNGRITILRISNPTFHVILTKQGNPKTCSKQWFKTHEQNIQICQRGSNIQKHLNKKQTNKTTQTKRNTSDHFRRHGPTAEICRWGAPLYPKEETQTKKWELQHNPKTLWAPSADVTLRAPDGSGAMGYLFPVELCAIWLSDTLIFSDRCQNM